MSFPAFANFSVPSSKAGLGDYSVQPRTIAGDPTGAAIGDGLTSTYAWRGDVPDDAATVDLMSESVGVIDTQELYRSPADETGVAAAVWAYGGGRTLTDGRIVQQPRTAAIPVELYRGDRYGPGWRTLPFNASDGGDWPLDLSGFAWHLRLVKLATNRNLGVTPIDAALTIGQATGDSRHLTLTLAAAVTVTLAEGPYNYTIVGVAAGGEWTARKGRATVISKEDAD